MSISDIYVQTLAVIPFGCEGNAVVFIWDDSKVMRYLEYENIPYALHGMFHKNIFGKYEFMYYSKEYEERVNDLLKKIECSQFTTNIFVPPHNYLDFRWEKLLKQFGYNIVSGTKRQFDCDKNSHYCRSGTIQQNGIYYIPQTLMLRKKDFYNCENYFDKIVRILDDNAEVLNDMVVTIHGYEFLEDEKFFAETRDFFKKLEMLGVENATYQNYCCNDECKIRKDLFYGLRRL